MKLSNVDIVHDLLNFPYPFDDKIFDKIYCKHVIEHFVIDDIYKILSECHRLLASGGELIITVPHSFSVAAYTDPTHKTFFTFNSGKFWDKNHSKAYYFKVKNNWKLKKISCRVCWFDWKKRYLIIFDKLLSYLANLRLSKALLNKNSPSKADRLVKKYSFQFVEIKWVFNK